jgi:hypothetical protein
VSEEGSADERPMSLPSSGKVDPGKTAPNREAQRWNVYLCKIDVCATKTMDAGDRPPINNRELQGIAE